MKVTLALLLVLAANVSGQAYQRVCKPTEIVFLLDHSENARKASTTGNGPNFQLLKDAWEGYMTELAVAGDNLFRIWAWSYSSGATPQQLVVRGSSPSQSHNPPIGTISSGGSWTYMGLEQIKDARPSLLNNIVIIISAQGSMNDERRLLAQNNYQILRNNGWNTYVIGVKSSQSIDTAELTTVNGNNNPVILDDGRPTNKKSYTLLPDALRVITNSILCTQQIVTPPTQKPIIPTLPPSTGICSNCKLEGGYGFDRHPTICDSFYQCMPDGSYVLKQCSQSTVWDDAKGTCVRANQFSCPTGQCYASLAGRTYTSGVCCNMYFRCDGNELQYLKCPPGQIYNDGNQQCVPSNNPINECAASGGFYCNERIFNEPMDCGPYSPDPHGNPCSFMHLNIVKNTSMGTIWDQNACALVKSDVCDAVDYFSTRQLSNPCTAIFLATFDSGRPNAESERYPQREMAARLTNVIRARGSLVFQPNGPDGSAYFYFFNNNELPTNSAFKIIFQLDNSAQIGLEYDLFSNNYCPLCPETYGASIMRQSGSSCVITTRFVDSVTRAVVRTSTQVNNIQNGDWLDLDIIWGDSDVHGIVKTLSSNKAVTNTVQIVSASHTNLATAQANKCGIVLGGGPNAGFVGMIDYFAYYSHCSNIEDITRK